MVTPLPTKDAVLAACTGKIALPHPVLQAARDLNRLHVERTAGAGSVRDIDRARAELVHHGDQWVAANKPECRGGVYLHSESVGMVVDRLAAYSTEAHAALGRGAPEPERHYLWKRLAQLALAYGDLAYEVSTGRRDLPDFVHTVLQYNSTDRRERDGF